MLQRVQEAPEIIGKKVLREHLHNTNLIQDLLCFYRFRKFSPKLQIQGLGYWEAPLTLCVPYL